MKPVHYIFGIVACACLIVIAINGARPSSPSRPGPVHRDPTAVKMTQAALDTAWEAGGVDLRPTCLTVDGERYEVGIWVPMPANRLGQPCFLATSGDTTYNLCATRSWSARIGECE